MDRNDSCDKPVDDDVNGKGHCLQTGQVSDQCLRGRFALFVFLFVCFCFNFLYVGFFSRVASI